MLAGEAALASQVDGDMEVMAKRAEKEALLRAAAALSGGDVGESQKRKFVPASSTAAGVGSGGNGEGPVSKFRAAGSNPDEIDIDDDSMVLSERPVPSAVFGGVTTADV